MTELELRQLINMGEGHHLEFKEESVHPDSLKKTIVCFANTDGGKILVGISNEGAVMGVTNPDKKMLDIENVAYNNCEPPITILQETVVVDGKTIVVVNIPKGSQRPYRTNDGKYYIRSTNQCRDASREELLRIFQSSEAISYDELPVNRASINDLSLHSFVKFLRDKLQISIEETDTDELQSYLINLKLMNRDKIPTITGLLFIGENPQKFLPQARIICGNIDDVDLATAPSDRKEVLGTVPEMIENTEKFLKIHLKQKHLIEDFKPELEFELPIVAIREAVVNAIAHRDYTLNSPIRIIIYTNRLEIRSPGKLPNTVTIESMKTGTHYLRNSYIYNMLLKLGFVTDFGSGVARMIKMIKSHIGMEVEFNLSDTEFTVTIPRPVSKT